MARWGSDFLQVNQALLTNDYMVAGNNCFYASMQGDGNFVVYRGSGPSDSHGVLWATNKYGPAGSFFAVMQGDGNFCVYKGTGPWDNQGIWWATNVYDPPVNYSIQSINYDLSNAKLVSDSPTNIFTEHIQNNTPNKQTTTISGTASYTETKGWSDTLGIKVGAQAGFEVQVPMLGSGKIQLSAEASYSYTWSGSQSTTQSWTFSVPVTIDPGTQGIVLVVVSVATLVVPYTLTGTVIFQSGKTMPGVVHGVFTGTNSHDLSVTFQQI